MNSHRTLCAGKAAAAAAAANPADKDSWLSLSLALRPPVRPSLAGWCAHPACADACVPARTSFSSCEPTMYIQTSELLR